MRRWCVYILVVFKQEDVMTAITEDFEARTKSEAAQKLHEAGFIYAGFDDFWMSRDRFAKIVRMPARNKFKYMVQIGVLT
jgi:hypothetical protein